jgi:deoxynucleoside triphosphate triphosphohydrolase SAMHD1
VGFKELWEKHLTPENIAAEVVRNPPMEGIDGSQTLTADDVIVDWSILHMGLKEKNPMHYVKFYSKQQPNCMFLSS